MRTAPTIDSISTHAPERGAIVSFRSGAKALTTDDIVEPRPDRTWFVQGLANNLLNPKGALFYLGVFTMVITPETSASAMLVLIFSMMLRIDNLDGNGSRARYRPCLRS